MNKDKIIKDLKKRNDSLKMQYEYRNIRCINLENENQRLLEENQQLKKSIKLFTDDLANMTNRALQLEKQKDDVVEYIKTTTYSDITGLEKHNITEFWFIKDLLRMLGEIDETSIYK